MKYYIRYFWILLLLIILSACENNPTIPTNSNPHDSTSATFSNNPVNMFEFNSVYDDFNSSSPTLGSISPLCFSSNRNNNNFNIVYKLLRIQYTIETGILLIDDECAENLDAFTCNENLHNAMEVINTNSNEFGPYLKYLGRDWPNNQYLILYSNNLFGNQDIKFTHNFNTAEYIDPFNISFLNTEFNDEYPTFNDVLNPDKIYFSSNRDGNYDIYYVSIDPSNDVIQELMSDEVKDVFKENTLSSSFSDKCPMTISGFMVFSSNRPGGYGGFDLYFSYHNNGNWSEPVNFGSRINTEFNEYRPYVKQMPNFTNDFMIFSSNRPGGLGGFDLYYVGIENIE